MSLIKHPTYTQAYFLTSTDSYKGFQRTGPTSSFSTHLYSPKKHFIDYRSKYHTQLHDVSFVTAFPQEVEHLMENPG